MGGSSTLARVQGWWWLSDEVVALFAGALVAIHCCGCCGCSANLMAVIVCRYGCR